MKLVDKTGHEYQCGKVRREPNFFYFGNSVEGRIDGKPAQFCSNYPNSEIVYFKLDGECYYFKSTLFARYAYEFNEGLLEFTSKFFNRKPAAKRPARAIYGEMFAGRSVDLIGDSKIKSTERNDCTVLATMETARISYDEAHQLMSKHRQRGKGAHMSVVLATDPWFTKNYRKVKLDRKMTTGTFAKSHPTGRYMLIIRGHALAVCDGKIYDYGLHPRKLVLSAWEFIG